MTCLMRCSRLWLVVLSLGGLLSEPACEDSPSLTTIWESTSTGNSDRLIDTLIQNHDFASHRSGDCRGPLFWAFEFKNVDALALYMHLGVSMEQSDNDGKSPKEFFDGTEDDLSEFLGEAKSKVEELSTLLAEREEEFYSFRSDGVGQSHRRLAFLLSAHELHTHTHNAHVFRPTRLTPPKSGMP